MIAEQMLDVFSSDELEKIKLITDKISEQKHRIQEKTYTNGFTSQDALYPVIKKLVIDKINERSQVKIKKLTVGMTLKTQSPFSVHSDFPGKGDSGHGHAFLIPLYQTPEPTDTRRPTTVIFEQSWTETGSMEDYIASNPVLPAVNAESIWDQHMTHSPKHFAKYLSVKMLYPWTYGSVVSWDRQLLHSSNNFLNFGVTEKCALVLFTNDAE